ncbi:MAG TPA: class I SAM-dependent methyltransferase [Caulobacteraceae bacterium]|nr:class I SAM-dependent methyltransferase [Caulobacteraceae bacterium]
MPINADNLAHWNEVTPHHVASPFYRTEDFRRGEIVLDPVVRDAIGDVAGQRLLHLQCHFGLDTLSLARMGASVTGLDFSEVAIAQARALAAEAGIDATFICADVLAPPPGLTGFDIVFASWGAIFWIADLAAWMRVAAGALKPGGRLCLTEGHPAMLMLDERAPPGAPLTVRWPWDSETPIVDVGDLDYTGAKVAANRTEGYLHGLSRILNTAMDAGLTIRGYSEGDRVPWKALDQLVKSGRDYWALPPDAPAVPLSFTLHAVKAG